MKKQQEGICEVKVLIYEYEAVSQKGDVPFFEKAAFLQIASYYHLNNQISKSIQAIDHALSFYAFDPEFHIFRTKLSLLENDLDGATQSIRELQKLMHQDEHTAIYRIEAYVALGQMDKANLGLDNLKNDFRPAKSSEKVFGFSEYLHNRRKTEAMFDYLAECLQADPHNAYALKHMYFCMEATGQYEEAIEIHQRVLEQDPMLGHAWYNLGIAFQQTGHTTDALDAFEYALICEPKFLEAYLDYAETAIELGLYKTALQTYQQICKEFEMKPEYLVQIGECYSMLGEKDISMAFYLKALSLNEDCATAHYRIGLIHLEKKEVQRAKTCFSIAQKIDPTEEQYDLSLASTQIELGYLAAALKSLKRAFMNNPENPACAIALTMLLIDFNKIRTAHSVIKEAMEYHNTEPVLTALRGVCLIRLGKRREGYNWIKEAVDEGLDNTDLVYRFLDDEADEYQH
jgi:tetratricopeptide (TPR) repeat protein